MSAQTNSKTLRLYLLKAQWPSYMGNSPPTVVNAFVAAAASEADALSIHPLYAKLVWRDGYWREPAPEKESHEDYMVRICEGHDEGAWVAPSEVSVTMLGTAAPGVKRGPILVDAVGEDY